MQSTSDQDLRNLARQITGKAPFDQDVLYRYDTEASPPSVTLYVTREGTPLSTLVTSEG